MPNESSENTVTSEQEDYSIIYSSESLLLQTQEDNPEAVSVFKDVSGFSTGALKILNQTSYEPDYKELLSEPLNFSPNLVNGDPAVLIIHTHGSEAYTSTAQNSYSDSDTYRTEDANYSVIRVGDEITNVLTEAGIGVIHETQLFDYPSYNGCYTRALERINEILKEHPTIKIILDIHRDAVIKDDGTELGSVCTINGEECSQVMFVVGTGEGGLPHPNWKENLKLALQLERLIQVKYDGLMRNLNLRKERFNQHATPGSLIVEVGCTGNTLEQALGAARRFAECAAEVILKAAKSESG
jgi:stage II sporulation protein P